ncbi:Bipolar DNA helicase [Smithella sp. ME-1]|uniref:Bipolar dna helicase n=1 Tax=hydrocarbon metagenome TaxID=938273 RepID=A0A0W8FMG6_9ZZZZ|nr:Bipolar DNA helicase [Smithella sp. ME-1]
MRHTPFAHAESLRIGSVDFISPDEVKVMLDIEAPESVALNAGGARPFPRVNSYVLIPVDDGYLVGQIEWLTIERSAFPKRRGVQDFGLVDLPYPLRKMSLNPIGTLRKQYGTDESYNFRRGADALPSVGAAVLLPTEKQLRSIVESGERQRVRIGISPLAGNAVVRIDPDRLFGRHLAVLGNTGSGKSCSVAGLIRWSLETARTNVKDKTKDNPNARFIILDPNGEYSRAFSGTDLSLKTRIFRVSPEVGELALHVPLWFWNSAEWVSFTQASAKTQKPTLVQSLRFLRDQQIEPPESVNHELRRFLRTMVTTIRMEKNSGSPWGAFPKPKSFWEKLEKWKQGVEPELSGLSGEELNKLQALVDAIENLCRPRRANYAHYDFTRQDIDNLLETASQAHSIFGGSESDIESVDADVPRPFTGDNLLRCVEATAEMMNVSENVETLLIRLRSLLADKQMNAVIGDCVDITLEKWLIDYVGADQSENGCLAVIDLSLVPSEIIHVVTAVTARMIFEALQRYRKLNLVTLPTVIVMEEAHTFIKRYKDDIENYDAATICCQVFERIAREGRKYGLGLVLSSQRPSELSPTVLSQCNTFLLHRISNDRDQELVHRLVPDNLRGLLRELPSLPSQYAILLGWASELPVLLKMDDLPKSQQPHSDDPDFWNVWTGCDDEDNIMKRTIDWKPVVDDWQGKSNVIEGNDTKTENLLQEMPDDDVPF